MRGFLWICRAAEDATRGFGHPARACTKTAQEIEPRLCKGHEIQFRKKSLSELGFAPYALARTTRKPHATGCTQGLEPRERRTVRDPRRCGPGDGRRRLARLLRGEHHQRAFQKFGTAKGIQKAYAFTPSRLCGAVPLDRGPPSYLPRVARTRRCAPERTPPQEDPRHDPTRIIWIPVRSHSITHEKAGP